MYKIITLIQVLLSEILVLEGFILIKTLNFLTLIWTPFCEKQLIRGHFPRKYNKNEKFE